jgi:hypothetical protein
MSKIKSFLFGVICISIYSCSSTRNVVTTNTQEITNKGIQQALIVTDLEVQPTKISGTYTGKNVSESDACNLAVSDALKKANAEVLVQPVYQIQIKKHNAVSVNVEGFPGVYKNFRKPSHSDSLVLGISPYSNQNNIADNKVLEIDMLQNIVTSHEAYNAIGNNIKEYNKYHKSGKKMLIIGGAFTFLGAAVGATLLPNFDFYTDNGIIAVAAYSGLSAAMGIPIMAIGGCKFHKANMLKQRYGLSGASVAVTPKINPNSQFYGLSMGVTF